MFDGDNDQDSITSLIERASVVVTIVAKAQNDEDLLPYTSKNNDEENVLLYTFCL